MNNEAISTLTSVLDTNELANSTRTRNIATLDVGSFTSYPIPLGGGNPVMVGIMHKNIPLSAPDIVDSHLLLDVSDVDATEELFRSIIKAGVYRYVEQDISDDVIDEMVENAMNDANISIVNIVKTVLNWRGNEPQNDPSDIAANWVANNNY